MVTCFLFIHHFNEDGCLSLSLDQQGQVVAPLEKRNFDEIKLLQKNCRTVLVLSAQLFSLHSLTLPWLAEKKARAAIPFALEDKLAQNVSSLHFAFDRHYYQNGQYLIVVGDKHYLTELINKFDDLNIEFDSITLDWFALNTQEIAVLSSCLLINEEGFQGALSPDLANFYLQKLSSSTENYSIYTFTNSNQLLLSILNNTSITTLQDNDYTWIAQRLRTQKVMNLCQGELSRGGTTTIAKRWYQAALLMSILWIVTLLGSNAIKLYQLNRDTSAVDTQIAIIYHQFFPQAQQVISPKFRITQLLKSNQNNTDSNFWLLLNTLAKVSKNKVLDFSQIRYQNQTLLVTLTTKNFEELENLQTQLQKTNIQVRQTQASTENNKVVGTLELSL
ncbi:type II secretion system protein GspL [Legionella hackeliae]|uniref:Type II secretion system protein L n=1 Tax=Legionella hackeliae TaxID=449 RepID=A0A0A8USI5_LEGHA|nr:type II secretion system protein GspL [Legionella hackeliae]KTD10534.1 general secretion pathway protein L [Legionella hackeliae]CEK10037.1 Type II secretory pathway protein LspL [Legionella hackeliae]STX46762.1 general secretion pathway protein L [Legionella hackeliae]